MLGVQTGSLVWKLRSPMPGGQKKSKQKQYCNKFNKELKKKKPPMQYLYVLSRMSRNWINKQVNKPTECWWGNSMSYIVTGIKTSMLCYAWLLKCSPPGPLFMGILQARILEWVALLSFKRSSPPRDRTQVPRITAWFFPIWATKEAQEYWSG